MPPHYQTTRRNWLVRSGLVTVYYGNMEVAGKIGVLRSSRTEAANNALAYIANFDTNVNLLATAFRLDAYPLRCLAS